MNDRTRNERARRFRERQARDALFVIADIPASLGVALIESGHISEQDALRGPRKLGEALVAYLQSLRKSVTPLR